MVPLHKNNKLCYSFFVLGLAISSNIFGGLNSEKTAVTPILENRTNAECHALIEEGLRYHAWKPVNHPVNRFLGGLILLGVGLEIARRPQGYFARSLSKSLVRGLALAGAGLGGRMMYQAIYPGYRAVQINPRALNTQTLITRDYPWKKYYTEYQIPSIRNNSTDSLLYCRRMRGCDAVPRLSCANHNETEQRKYAMQAQAGRRFPHVLS